jgi:hypothetical protein
MNIVGVLIISADLFTHNQHADFNDFLLHKANKKGAARSETNVKKFLFYFNIL